VNADGTLWCWGYNDYGQLGLSDSIHRPVPNRVGTDADWKTPFSTADSYSTCALKKTGSLWCWGSNDWGNLGLSDNLRRKNPTQVGSAVDWVQVAPAVDYSCGTNTGGVLLCAGAGPGMGGLSGSTFAAQAGIGWAFVSASGTSGYAHTCAVKSDHSLWCWGSNYTGQLGMGDHATRNTPYVMGADSDWAQVCVGGGSLAFTCAVRTDGSLWCWGSNDEGRLGIGSTAGSPLPVRVGADANWSRVACGQSHSCALKSDGSLWCWGRNGEGQLGVGDTSPRLSRTRVGSATDWAQVAPGGNFTCARKTDGSVWCWGDNTHGRLGTGGSGGSTSPVRLCY
jgi:alpha-tubulin suppressor-like RCC1 family protein